MKLMRRREGAEGSAVAKLVLSATGSYTLLVTGKTVSPRPSRGGAVSEASLVLKPNVSSLAVAYRV